MKRRERIIGVIVIFFIMFIGAACAQDKDNASPFVDGRSASYETFFKPEILSDIDPLTGERIITLDELVVRPRLTARERLIIDAKKRRDRFLTEKKLSTNFNKKLSSLDKLLNLDFLPRLGLTEVEIAKMHVNDRMIGRALKTMNDIQYIRKDLKNPYEGKDVDEMRFDLLRIKREAIVYDPNRDSF